METALDKLPQMPWKYKVAYLAYKFSQMEQRECPVRHSFHGDQYIREMFIPAGTLFIGRIHTNGHEVELVSGTAVDLQDGVKREVTAPFKFRSHPGYQAVFHAVTDVVGRTIHANPDGITDVKLLEDRDFELAEYLMTRGKMVAEKIDTPAVDHEEVPCLA